MTLPGKNTRKGAGRGDPISIVVIEDNRIPSGQIVERIKSLPGYQVLAASAEVETAVQTVCDCGPDIVLLEIGGRADDRLTLAGALHSKAPHSRVILLGLRPGDANQVAFVRAGAAGFVMADAPFERLLQTIRSVAAGIPILPAELNRTLFGQLARQPVRRPRFKTLALARLSRRQQDVAALLGQGLSDSAIALSLDVALQTVQLHVRTVLSLLAVNRRLEVGAFVEG